MTRFVLKRLLLLLSMLVPAFPLTLFRPRRSGAATRRVGSDHLKTGATRGTSRALDGAIHRSVRAHNDLQNVADLPRILDGGDQSQAPAPARAGEEIDLERSLHELGPGPMAGRRPRGGAG